MRRRRRLLWLSLAASALAHALLGWPLLHAPRRLAAPTQRETFQVSMVPVRPLAREPPSPAKAPAPEPPRQRKPPPKPEPKPPPKSSPKPPVAPPVAVAASVAAEPSTASPALLAESGPATGDIVQLGDASIAAVATARKAVPLDSAESATPRAAPLAKLSDLSRKPRAPSLDAALRENYPVELRRRGTEGEAEVRVLIDALGRVGEIAVLSESAKGFAEACRKTLSGSRWSEPLDRRGQPVSTRLTYRCRFQIER